MGPGRGALCWPVPVMSGAFVRACTLLGKHHVTFDDGKVTERSYIVESGPIPKRAQKSVPDYLHSYSSISIKSKDMIY